MKKQTAVEWFFEQLEFNEDVSRYEILEQAEQIHKQQMIDFATKYDEYCHNSFMQNRHQPIKSAEEFYNETFKS